MTVEHLSIHEVVFLYAPAPFQPKHVTNIVTKAKVTSRFHCDMVNYR